MSPLKRTQSLGRVHWRQTALIEFQPLLPTLRVQYCVVFVSLSLPLWSVEAVTHVFEAFFTPASVLNV